MMSKKRKREEKECISDEEMAKFAALPPKKGPCPFPGCEHVIKSHPERHWRVHTKEKPYKCQVKDCGRSFTQETHLKRHSYAHSGEPKPYACESLGCEMSFVDHSDFVRHTRIHTGETPYKCEFKDCEKQFTRADHLQLHERVHTGERPYVCDVKDCGKAFISSSDLRIHERVHTGERPYVCEFEGCGKSFISSGHLTIHERVHTGERPYPCEFPGCEYASTTSSHRDRHFWRMHTEEGKKQHKAKEDRMYKEYLIRGVTIDARCQRISFSCMHLTWAEPDFTIQKAKRIVFGECDENQHKDRILSCLLARVVKIQTSQIIAGETRNLVFLWTNPDPYKVDGMPGTMKYEERIDKSVDIIQNFEPDTPITIYIVCYDMTTNIETGEKYPCIFDDPDFDDSLKPFVKWIY